MTRIRRPEIANQNLLYIRLWALNLGIERRHALDVLRPIMLPNPLR
jgi:hypothetical protein